MFNKTNSIILEYGLIINKDVTVWVNEWETGCPYHGKHFAKLDIYLKKLADRVKNDWNDKSWGSISKFC